MRVPLPVYYDWDLTGLKSLWEREAGEEKERGEGVGDGRGKADSTKDAASAWAEADAQRGFFPPPRLAETDG